MADIRPLLELMALLRHPEKGCPWDREQTFATIAPFTLEEAYEVADAVARDDPEALRDELGDLLFQVVFHARMAEELGRFDFAGVVEGLLDKMVRRHPHVFGDAEVADAEEQTRAWERHKAAERRARDPREASVLDGVARALPALLRAEKLQRRAARVGFDWPDIAPVLAKVEEELAELRAELDGEAPAARVEAELGDLLFAVVNVARHAGVDAEAALRGANERFGRRFRRVESEFAQRGTAMHDAGLDELDAAWERAKAREE
ncbi:MAG: nucleoside triphosphate pyrophosphohydrolase [Gammaproteobacteria bacterium]|nr:nucleoside triphosphate pyrophosphohydrolase [Gammaproteobacteria bacterium]